MANSTAKWYAVYNTHSSLLESQVHILVTLCGFVVGEMESKQVILGNSPIFPCHKCHFTNFSIFISSLLISLF